MRQRGRKSANAVVAASNVEAIPRAAPPADLSEFEAHVWSSVVNTKPADWFQADTLPLLLSYCKHISHAATLDREIAGLDPKWLKDEEGLRRYKVLTDMRDRESRAQTALARSMRLTQQAQYSTQTAHNTAKKAQPKSTRPWES